MMTHRNNSLLHCCSLFALALVFLSTTLTHCSNYTVNVFLTTAAKVQTELTFIGLKEKKTK